MRELISFLIGYFCGAFLTAAVVVKVRTGKAVWDIGTGNPGMANVMAQCGKPAGFAVLIGDILKTVLAIFLSWLLFGRGGMADYRLWSGLGVLVGHNFPFWHHFRGGKGVTVTCSWMILTIPVWGIVCSLAGGAITLLTGYLPLGAVVIALSGAAAGFAVLGLEGGIFFSISAVLMCIAHRHGMMRVIRGEEERKFRTASKKKQT